MAIDNLIDLSQTASGASPTGSAGDTGWVDVLRTQIKTSSQKDLLFDVAMQCGIVTDTTVKSSGGTQSSSTARANMAVRVLVDGSPAMPDNSIDATKSSTDGVVFCDRVQTLSQLVLRSLNASSFNFAKPEVGTGVHTVTVQARARAGVNFADDASGGALAGAEAFAGAGSLAVDEVRLVRGASVMVDLG